MPDLPRLEKVQWQLQPVEFDDPAAAYASGFVGTWHDPEGRERLADTVIGAGGLWEASQVAGAYGFMEQGQGKLCLISEEIFKAFGRTALPGAAQVVGDCVSHSTKNAILGTLSTAINHGLSGMPITVPDGIAQGVLAPEAIYALRGYSGDGWSCEAALEVAIGKIGAVSRRNHPDAGWDLTRYSKATAHKYGGSRPPPEVVKALGDHKVSTVTRCKSYEEIRDMIASGFAITSCGGEGFASHRNEDGVSNRSGHWSHALSYLGVDDRAETKQRYGCGLVLVQNSWGKSWISGPTAVRGTAFHIPEGSFWAKWTDISSRFASAVNTVEKWQPRKLPDLGLGELI
jgi:hypothetical protein